MDIWKCDDLLKKQVDRKFSSWICGFNKQIQLMWLFKPFVTKLKDYREQIMHKIRKNPERIMIALIIIMFCVIWFRFRYSNFTSALRIELFF